MYKALWHSFAIKYGRLRTALLIIVVTLLVALFEGFNVGLLVPLLQHLDSGAGGDHWISLAFEDLFNAIGLSITLETILLALAVLVLTAAALKYLRMILVAKTKEGFIAWMRTSTMGNLLHTDISYFQDQRTGSLSGTLTTQAFRAGEAYHHANEMLASLGIILTYLTAAFLIAPALTAMAVGLLLLVSLALQYNVTRSRAIGGNLAERENRLQATSVESLSGIRVIKAFLLEPFQWTAFRTRADEVAEASYRLGKHRSQMVVFHEAALFGLIGGIVFLGVSLLGFEISIVVALLFILYRLTPRIVALNSERQTFAGTIAALHDVNRVMEEASHIKVADGAQPFAGLKDEIAFSGVGFSYDPRSPVLKGVSFTAKKGQLTAIVGGSGVGKTTVIDLLLRFYDPLEGSVMVDSADLRELDLATWRRAIGLVSQDVFLFNDSVFNNIAVGNPDSPKTGVVAAAKRAFAHDFIEHLPMGYDTVIGEQGWNLSGGQRQRIALARAILREPEILILDEATSALDSESEQAVQEHIKQVHGECTILVVAHRTSTIQGADKILVLQDGQIVEEGDWDSLLANAGVFANYHKLQSGA
ncbi:MAG: ABC transporter ATP-binding protein [Dehalococcoidia bacterium]|nr:ABC transporter ATP-binding protein [Dehalococcoidia bacterium]